MSIKLILNYINEPTLKNKEALTKNIKPKDRKWFENYILKDLINKKEIKPFKQLYRISNNIKNNENTIISEIYRIIQHPQILIRAYGNIAKNKGTMAKGIDKRTIDRFSINHIYYLHNQLKNKTYKPSPVRRVWIPKPGKPYPQIRRPLAVPTIYDKIVQESIRMVLNEIYEPIFEKINYNFGFRKKKSPFNAILYLKQKINGYNLAIEGDIKGAYDNLEQETLLKILNKRIKDNNFIKLIDKILKAGIIDEDKKIHSLTGVIQGSTLSPLLFNIYLHEFDLYIKYDINNLINLINKKQKRTLTGKRTKEIYKILYQLKLVNNKIKKEEKNTKKYKELIKQKNLLTKKRFNTQVIDNKTKNTKITYCRFADDWILVIDGPKQLAILIKNKIQTWLKTYLKLELSEEKTKITNLKNEWAHFLGFSIKIQKKHKRIKKVTINNKTFTKRTGAGNTIVTIDINRLVNRLKTKRFMHPKKKYTSYHKPEWTIFEDKRIIILYKQVIYGIFNYYKESINIKNELYFIYYILKSSCAKTLASKFKLHYTKKIFNKYGPNLQIGKQYIPTFKELIERESIRNITPHIKDPLEITTNWRTRMKLLTYCVICSSTEKIEMHHIKRLRGPTGENVTKGFNKIMGAINRKQIPVCQKCHNKIHNGTYNDKSLNEIFTDIQNKELLAL